MRAAGDQQNFCKFVARAKLGPQDMDDLQRIGKEGCGQAFWSWSISSSSSYLQLSLIYFAQPMKNAATASVSLPCPPPPSAGFPFQIFRLLDFQRARRRPRLPGSARLRLRIYKLISKRLTNPFAPPPPKSWNSANFRGPFKFVNVTRSLIVRSEGPGKCVCDGMETQVGRIWMRSWQIIKLASTLAEISPAIAKLNAKWRSQRSPLAGTFCSAAPVICLLLLVYHPPFTGWLASSRISSKLKVDVYCFLPALPVFPFFPFPAIAQLLHFPTQSRCVSVSGLFQS